MHSHRIIGLPGTGKTTHILKEIDTLVKKDITVYDFAFTTFSSKMASENRSEITNRYDLNYKELYNIGTIHGLCRRLLNVDIRERLLTAKDIKRFAKEFGIETKGYTPHITDIDDFMTIDGGMLLLSADSWLRNGLLTFDDIDKFPGYDKLTDEFDIDVVPDFMDAYNHYKKDNGKVDFTDLLEFVCESGQGMDVTAFFTDEAQDLNPLLNNACNVLKQDVEYDFIVGDPFQSIYSFMGSDSRFLMDTKVDKETILPITYRYGKDVIDFSTELLESAGHDNIPVITSDKKTNIISMDTDEYFDYALPGITENTFHLVRCGYMGYPIAKHLIDCGVPFTGLFGWNDIDISIFNGLVEYRNEGRIQTENLVSLINVHPSNFFTSDKKELVNTITNAKKLSYNTSEILNISSPLSQFSETNFIASLKKPLKYADISDTQYNRITNCLTINSQKLDKKTFSTAVMTIHGSKGMQANNVFVWDEINRTITNSIDELPQMLDESKVWYVASTRCKHNLYLINSNKRYCWEVAT